MTSATFPPRPMRIAIFLAAVGVVLFGSIAPAQALPEMHLWDKTQHAIGYCVLMALGAWAFRRWAWVAAGLLAMSLVVELIQAAMPFGRVGDVGDGVANALGIAVAYGLAKLAARR